MEKQKELTKKTRYNIQYAKEKIKRVPLDMQMADYERLKEVATANGEGVNTYIKKAIAERMERGQYPGSTQQPAGAPQADKYTGPGSSEWWAHRTPGGTTEGAGQFPYYPDDEDTPQAAVGTSPMEAEESSPADQIRLGELPF